MHALCRDCCEIVELGPGDTACEHCASTRLVRHDEIATLTTAHVDCDAFYASVEKRDRPDLADKPLIVGHPGGRGVVTTCCYIARTYGVRSAMPMFKATELCPDAVILKPDMARYKAVSDSIRDIFLAATPVIEPVSLDEAYLDLSEEHRHEGPTAASALAHIALRVEREVRITVSIGLGPNKFLAKLASDLDKPRGFAVIGAAEAARTLAAMPVKKIHGVGAVTAERMEALGLSTIADLQTRSEAELTSLFGAFGRRLALYAQGHDERRVTPSRETKSVSAEDTFARNTASCDDLCAAIEPMCTRVANQMIKKRLSGRTVVIKLKTHDFKLISRHARLQHPTQKPDLIYDAASKLIAREADGRYFRLVGVGMTDLTDAASADPPGLFDV